MSNSIDRRFWLKQTAIALAGLGIAPTLLAAGKSRFFLPGNAILLNSNENAYGPSPLARKAIMEAYLNSNRYPDDAILLLKKKIAAHWNVNVENILMGAGSSEIIGLACLHAAKSKGNIVTAEPSYRVWNDQATAFGLTFKRTALDKERKTDLPSMLTTTDDDTRMIYICNPNNPVGTDCEVDALSVFAAEVSKKTMVFIDEAYTEFAELDSLAPLAVRNKNIIVAKTFSKIYGLAGARVGYAIGHPETIKTFSSYQPWPDAAISMVSAAAAMAALDDQVFVKECREKIKASRESCYTAFKHLSLDYIPSHANFILFNIDKIKGDFIKQMQEKNIYVQYREHFGGKWCRVSMGTTEEMQAFIKTLKEIAA
jgi:histidinol-phosphate aminotransferase